jgi:type IV pilus assembly protein PilY1
MRRTKLYPLVVLVLGLVPGRASAQLADTRPVKPVMMLLVDTSGSMERMPSSATCDECLPTCSNNTAADSTQKNRWALALEALTGTFKNYACVKKDRATYVGAYDQDYFLPHYDFTTNAALPANGQIEDGVLDAYKSRLKFGLMTFDGVSTTLNGATLVPQSNWTSDATLKPKILGVEGMYSYPDTFASPSTNPALDTPKDVWGWKPLSFPGCTSVYGVNAGARSKGTAPGSLISFGPGDSEGATAIATINDSIQSSLLQVRPFGGTPIAGMLDDFRYYLNNDADVKKGSDVYYGCRQRFGILLTDGAPDTSFRNDARFQCESASDATCAGGVCQCPYDTEPNLASTLVTRDGLSKLWVVAFNVNDTASLAKLDQIAQAGSQLPAFRASSMADLRTSLDSLMREAQRDATSRSVPVVINTGNQLQLGGKQFQVTAGFKIGESETDPWEGRLYRQRITCQSSVATPQDLTATDGGDQFHITLNKRSTTRSLQTVAPSLLFNYANGSLYNATVHGKISSSLNNRRPNNSVFATLPAVDDSLNAAQSLQEFNKASLTPLNKSLNRLYFGDANGNSVSSEVADRDLIVDYLQGVTTARTGKRLGDIYHSNPVVTLPIYPGSDTLKATSPELRKFYTDLLSESGTGPNQGKYKNAYGAGRPGVVYVGSNDGILHAFNLDDWVDKSGTPVAAGYEFWGFTPPALFDKLSASVKGHQFMFDGTPVVRDMVFNKTPTGTTTMKTILISAVRGAPSFVALDVTFPDQTPGFLWQRTFPYVGETVGQPALATVKVNWGGTAQVRSVAILPGGSGVLASNAECNVDVDSRGKPASGGRDKVRCWKVRGRSLYVVDVETGELIQEFDSRHFPSPMTGGVAVDGDGIAQSRAAYLTDEDGVLWRLSMMNPDPSYWRVAPIWDLYYDTALDFSGSPVVVPAPVASAGRTSPYPPLLDRDPLTGNLSIIVGTGDVDNLADKTPNRIVSLKESRVLATDGSLELNTTASTGTVTANWKLQLDTGEAVTGPPVILNDTVYLTTFTGPAGGTGDICELGSSRIIGADVRKVDSTVGLPLPKLTPASGTGALVLQYKPSTLSTSLLLGLSITRDPICLANRSGNDPLVPTSGRLTPSASDPGGAGSYQVRSMVAGSGGTVMGGSAVSDKGQKQFKITLPIANFARSVGWASSIE